MADGPIAVETEAANEQHYEVPADVLCEQMLGPHLKYSSCLWDDDCGAARRRRSGHAATDMPARRVGRWSADSGTWLRLGFTHAVDGRASAGRIDRGGFELPVAAGVHPSSSAVERGIENVDVRVCGTSLNCNSKSDSTVWCRSRCSSTCATGSSYSATSLPGCRPGGKCFLHTFCHRELFYPFEDNGSDDWMARALF